MRATIVAALIGLAAAAPAVVYTEVVDVYTTVFEDGSSPDPTPAPAAPHYGHGHHHPWGSWGAPAADTPAPVADTPAPVADTPAPVADTPAPAAPEVVPTTPAWSPAAPAATAASPPAGSYTGAGDATPSDYSAAVVAHHNAHRANHSAPDLTWDAGLASTAQKIAASCVYAHDV
jgi:hypothetical protein